MSKRNSYSGYYKPKNKSKYVGKKSSIIWRSLWERGFCKWCDNNPKVVKWAIEPYHISYYDKGKGKQRKYYPDFFMEMENGNKYLIEVKPDYETKPPAMKKGTKRHLLAESTWITNSCKWDAAEFHCKQKNWSFKIVTEHTLKKLGIKIITKLPRRKKGVSNKKVKYTNRKTSSGLKS